MLNIIANTGADYTWIDAQALRNAVASPMDPKRLARLDIGLFWHLKTLGTSASRLRGVFGLDKAEYDYLIGLGR